MEESGTPRARGWLATGWTGLIAVLLTVALYCLSFPPYDLPEAAYVFAVPVLLYAAFFPARRGEGWVLFAAGWLAWVVLIFWLRNVTSHLSSGLAPVLGWLAVLLLAAIVAVFWWAWMWTAVTMVRACVKRRLPARIGSMLMLASLWVLLEWLRGTLFTGFPWLPLAASQWERPLLLQVTSLTGSAGLSFILIVFNLGLVLYLHTLWRQRRERWWKRLSVEFYLALGLLFGAISFGLQASGAGKRGAIEGPRFALVQPDIGAVEKWDRERISSTLGVLDDLTVYAAYLGAEVVLWPEAPTPFPALGNARMASWVEALAETTGLSMLIGNLAVVPDPDGGEAAYYNAVLTVEPGDGLDRERFYAKRHLVPFGEYLPFADWVPFARTIVPVPTDMSPGSEAQLLRLDEVEFDLGEAGLLICYEDIFSGLARENVRAGADWHFVASNNEWFGKGGAAWQHMAHSVLRAVETRRPVVRCGNAGWSGWIDEFGQIRHVMHDEAGSIYFQGVDTFEFSRNRWWAGRQSLYVQLDDWFVGASLATCALGLLGFVFTPKAPVRGEAAAPRQTLRARLRGKP